MPSAWPTAAELMTVHPATLPFDAPISRALGLMRTKDTGRSRSSSVPAWPV